MFARHLLMFTNYDSRLGERGWYAKVDQCNVDIQKWGEGEGGA